jgi:hypothetical protein
MKSVFLYECLCGTGAIGEMPACIYALMCIVLLAWCGVVCVNVLYIDYM